MLESHIEALQIACALLGQRPNDQSQWNCGELQRSLRTIDSLLGKTAKAQTQLAPGTSHHALVRNRLRSLQRAQDAVLQALKNLEGQ